MIKTIHQFHPAIDIGDGVSNGLLFTQKLLRQLGFESEIFCEHIPPALARSIKPLALLARQKDYLLFVHHSLGYENDQWLKDLSIPKIMVYHNITPVDLLPVDGPLRRLSALGRQQLVDWAPGYVGAIGDSESNSAELRAASFPKVITLPLLVDVDRVRAAAWDQSALAPLRDAINMLYVGRINDNKHQLDLLDVVDELRHYADQPVRLILVGGFTSPQYLQRIEDRIQALSLQNEVVLTGKVPDSTLNALYRAADVFVCLSEHEGFGMPLIEAMIHDLPVIAQALSGVPDTLGEGGLLVSHANPRKLAALIHILLKEPGLRRSVLAGQRRNLQRFAGQHLLQSLAAYLAELGVQVPKPAAPAETTLPKPYWQVQGPFDSSYSLAIVNREIARALAKRQHDIGLRSMEGGGDFAPNARFLAANPDCAQMVLRASNVTAAPDVGLRCCYPPHVDGMAAGSRVLHSYGWEETGFPAEYVDAFNRKLDLVTVVSEFVKKVLQDNGVRIPVAVTSDGADHLLHVLPKAPTQPLRGFSFLHISSCFPRKGVDALLAAYGTAFRQADDVSLVIKTFPNPHNDVAAQLAQLQRSDPGFPHVLLIEQDCSDEELVGWYQACDAFVAPSRGEGFGLPMAEAMLFNLPVITTNWGGQLDFCDDSTAWLCDYQFEKTSTHLGTSLSVWANPDVAHLARLLQELHQLTPLQRGLRTAPARQRILGRFTWAAAAARIERAVAALDVLPLLRHEPKIGWISTWNKRCGIANYSAFLTMAMPPDRLTVFADRNAELTAPDGVNVVRNWRMQTAETLDELVADVLARHIEVVVVQYNFGFFTLATLASLIQRLGQADVAVHVFFHATADLMRQGQTISLASIAPALAQAQRLYVHGVPDLNRLKGFGLIHNVVLFPHGVLPAQAPESRRPPGLANVPEQASIIAAYGFLLPHKGLRQLIQAFAELAHDNSFQHLLLLNALYPAPESNAELSACQALIKKLKLGERVTLSTDFLSDHDCVATLQAADLIVFPYQQTQESSSAAVRMGLAAGRPVAVTPLPIFDDVAEAVHRLPGTQPQELAAGLRALLSDPAALKRQADKTAHWMASCQWPKLSVRLLNLIDGLANALPE